MFTQYQTSGLQLLFIGVIFFFYKSGESMLDTTVRPYLLQVVCFKKYPGNESECLSCQNQEISDDVQKEASVYFFLYRLAANVPAVATGLYLGAWSDKHGRRLPMVFSCVGTILAVLIYMCSMYVKVKSKSVWIILAGTLLQGFSGKGVVLSMIVNCFISEFSNDSNVTKHTGMLFSMNFFGQCFGALLACISEWSLLDSFATVIGLNLLCVLIILVFVKDTKNKKELDSAEFAGKESCSADTERTKSYKVGEYFTKAQDNLRPNAEKQLNLQENGNEHYSASGDMEKQNPFSCCMFFNGFKSFWTVATKKRTKANKFLIVILLLLTFVNTCDISGAIDVLLLFVTRGPFNWSNSLYSFFVASENISIGVTLVLILPFLSKSLKLSDFKLIVIGLLCKIARCICIAVSSQTWMIFVLNIWSGSSFLMCVRSVLSKCVEEDELGKIFSIYSVIEIAGKFIGSIAYLSIYGATVSTAPSITFFVMGFINSLLVIALVVTRKIFENTDRFEVVPIYVKGTFSSSEATNKISQPSNLQQ